MDGKHPLDVGAVPCAGASLRSATTMESKLNIAPGQMGYGLRAIRRHRSGGYELPRQRRPADFAGTVAGISRIGLRSEGD